MKTKLTILIIILINLSTSCKENKTRNEIENIAMKTSNKITVLNEIDYKNLKLLDGEKYLNEYNSLYNYGKNMIKKDFTPLIFCEEKNNIALVGYVGKYYVFYFNKKTKIKNSIEIDEKKYMEILKILEAKK